jgi:ankyrin repeat protein
MPETDAALLERIANGRTDLVFDLAALAGGAAATHGHQSAPLISWCARYGDVSAIRFLLARGGTLESLGPDLGLAGAAFHGHWRLCEFLLERGADVNHAAADTGETPLHAALCKPNRPAYDLVVRVLLAAGADPNRPTRPGVETSAFMRDARTKGETPLHRAAAFGSEETIQILLDRGAKRDARDAGGDSPLSWASWHTRPDAILRMLCYGEFRIHPDRNSSFDHGAGWGFLEKDLLGTPRG